ISAVLDPGDPAGPIPPDCELAASADLGPLDPGDYTVTANIILPDRSGANAASMFTIVARGNKCNVDPLYNQLQVTLSNKTPDAFQTALATDSAYRALLGPIAFVRPWSFIAPQDGAVIAFPPLDDPVRVMDRLQRTGEFNQIFQNSVTI